jgi:hypothetical protein
MTRILHTDTTNIATIPRVDRRANTFSSAALRSASPETPRDARVDATARRDPRTSRASHRWVVGARPRRRGS